MEVRKGYKQTEIGLLPEDWNITALGKMSTCVASGRSKATALVGTYPVYGSTGIIGYSENGDYSSNAILIARVGANAGKLNLVSGQYGVTDNTIIVKTQSYLYLPFLWYQLQVKQLNSLIFGSGQPLLTGTQIKRLIICIPPLPEQRAIAAALSDVDALLAALDALIAKKRLVKQGAMQELLTGKRRLPGFGKQKMEYIITEIGSTPKDWGVVSIGDIATPKSEKNSERQNFPVLTCSKHLGFVDSLKYFKNQIFSNNTSDYKIIRRGELGYPANHIEEGSIGYQDLYDKAIVSPIYVVFSVSESMNGFFLHRTLKLERYRQIFRSATSASVDRRGSLRWPVFSKIRIPKPPVNEQNAIATVISDMDTEIAALEQRREKTRLLKQGMMQELLTGKIRLNQDLRD